MPTLVRPMAHTGERINYLSLALQARSAIKRLKSLAASKPTPELKATLQAVLNSLKAIKAPEGLFSKLHDEMAYYRFEEIQTVDEVTRVLDDVKLSDGLKRILTSEDYGKDDVRIAIAFFSAIENRALYHYNDPSLAEISA